MSCHRSRGLAKLAKRLFSLVVVAVAVAVEWKTRFIAYFDKSGTHIKSEHKKTRTLSRSKRKAKKKRVSTLLAVFSLLRCIQKLRTIDIVIDKRESSSSHRHTHARYPGMFINR